MKLIATYITIWEPNWTNVIDTDLLPTDIAAEIELAVPFESVTLTRHQFKNLGEAEYKIFPCTIDGMIIIYER